MEKPTGWYVFNGMQQLDSPALVIYSDRVKYNIDLAISMAGGVKRLRPHTKTHKCKEAALLQIGAGITQFKCATIAEAELLGMCNAEDVLLAYQPVGMKINRFVELIKKYPGTDFSCLVDNIKIAEEISITGISEGLKIKVYIDLNVGMDRTGIILDKALDFYLKVNLLKGISPVGLHAYDGHIHDADLQVRNLKAELVYKNLQELRQVIINVGLPNPIIIAGGTPTFPFYAGKNDVICSPGTYIYWDAGYGESFTEQQFIPAALVITRVVSLPTDTKICLDLGHKSVAAENVLDKRVRFLNAPGLLVTGQSEEHLIVEACENHGYKPGDLIYALPYHICPTVALYDKAVTVENNQITGYWPTLARSRKINI